MIPYLRTSASAPRNIPKSHQRGEEVQDTEADFLFRCFRVRQGGRSFGNLGRGFTLSSRRQCDGHLPTRFIAKGQSLTKVSSVHISFPEE